MTPQPRADRPGPDEPALGSVLRRRADSLTDLTPLHLADVKGRARGIRRRRAAVSGLAAAAVLAVAVPVGLSLAPDGTPGGPPAPPVASGPGTPPERSATDPAPAQPLGQPVGQPLGQPLTTEVPPGGAAPGIPMLDRGTLVLPDRRTLPAPSGAESVTPLGDGVALLVRARGGDTSVHVLDADGREVLTAPAYGAVVGSADGTVVAWATPDGTVLSLGVGAADPVALPDIPGGTGAVEAVGLIGSGSCEPEGPGGGCTVYYTQGGDTADPTGGWITSRGIGGPIQDARSVSAVSATGEVAVMRSADDDGSCSALLGAQADGEAWGTCDHTLGAFSPDGRWMIGWPAYRDGIGDGSLAILDTGTGRPMASWDNGRGATAFVADAAWDGDTVLATVFAEGSWSVLRLSPDGSSATVAADLGSEMEEAPVRF